MFLPCNWRDCIHMPDILIAIRGGPDRVVNRNSGDENADDSERCAQVLACGRSGMARNSEVKLARPGRRIIFVRRSRVIPTSGGKARRIPRTQNHCRRGPNGLPARWIGRTRWGEVDSTHERSSGASSAQNAATAQMSNETTIFIGSPTSWCWMAGRPP